MKNKFPDLSIQKLSMGGYKIILADRELYRIYPDSSNKITEYEIISDSICFMDICPGDKIDKVKKLFPELPINILDVSQREFFAMANDKVTVKLNVYSNLQGQVVGSYTNDSPNSSLNYSFDGYVRSIRITAK